ncbi:hypothetical protein [Pleomorphovibrio marinus]|uniref:hypothetical protein n=1 Tax=Pleomorphovibrio marinus TaxID=2164132 RepID=UPI0018E5A226|nr:hypothetical protein [Pleomorphovibrio marinus]
MKNPLRAENAFLTAEHHLYCSSPSNPIRFVYEQRNDRTEPVFQPWVRFAVLVNAQEERSSSMVRLKGFATSNGVQVEVAEMSRRFSSLPRLDPRNTNSPRAIFLEHGEIDLVTFQASDDIIAIGALYTTANFFDGLEDWKVLDYIGPLTAANTDDVLAPADPIELARARLKNMRPIRRVAEPGTGGLGSNITNHNQFEENLSRQAEEWAEMMKLAYKCEINETGPRPPGTITVDDLVDTDFDGEHPDSKLKIPFYGLIQASSFQPHIAAILGLGYFDEEGKDGISRDYAVDGVISTIWHRYGAYTEAARTQQNLQQIRKHHIAHGLGSDSWMELTRLNPLLFQRLVSYAINIKAGNPDPIPHPMLNLRSIPDASQSPVQARVELTVSSTATETRPLVWRTKPNSSGEVELDLMPLDGESGLLLAALPSEEGKVSVYDGSLPSYGITQYGAVNIDVFGRASAVINASINVRDLVPPPSPGTPEVTLGQTETPEGRIFTGSSVSFLWSKGAAEAAADVVGFNLLWKAGYHLPAEVLRRPDGQKAIAWQPSPNEGYTEDTILTENLDLPTVYRNRRREVTVVCTAKDRAGNFSAPSPPGHGIRIDEIKVAAPTQPDEPEWSSWPDAKGEVRWRCRWAVPADVQASRLLVASETRILSLSSTDRTAHLALSPAARATALKRIASRTPYAFMPTELALPAPIDHADVVMKSGSQDWCVAVIEFIGATGQKADWPEREDAFAVIRPRGLELLPPPLLRINLENRIAKFTAEGSVPGKVEIFTVAHPRLIEAATALGPVANILVPRGEDQETPSVDLEEWQNEWVGFAAWLWADDGRRSELSPILWRRL